MKKHFWTLLQSFVGSVFALDLHGEVYFGGMPKYLRIE